VLKKLPPNASPPPPKARSGRPSKTSKTQDQRLKAYVEKYLRGDVQECSEEAPSPLHEETQGDLLPSRTGPPATPVSW